MPQPSPASPARPLKAFVRWLARLFVGLLVLYVGVIIVLMWLENWFVYHPVKASEVWEQPAAAVEDVWLTSADGTKIHGWWCPTPNARWVVLYCHGNAGNVSRWHAGAKEWQEKVGASVLVFDYPGYGRSEGKPSEAGCHAAAEAAYRWLVEVQKVPPERLVLHGVSLGGAMAVELARDHPHAALVLLCAFTNVPDMAQQMFPFLPARWIVRHRFDNLAKLKDHTGPLFIAHGDADELVPYDHGTCLFAACPARQKELFPILGGRHNNSATDDYYAAVKSFLARCEKPADWRS